MSLTDRYNYFRQALDSYTYIVIFLLLTIRMLKENNIVKENITKEEAWNKNVLLKRRSEFPF